MEQHQIMVRIVPTAMSGTFSISCLYHPPLSQLSQPKAARPREGVIAEILHLEHS